MFSALSTFNSRFEAEIIFKNGDTKTWAFPEAAGMTLAERWGRGRQVFWIWYFYEAWSPKSSPDTARYIARAHYNLRNPPHTVCLIRYTKMIPSPFSGRYPASLDPTPFVKDEKPFFIYEVTPKDLQ